MREPPSGRSRRPMVTATVFVLTAVVNAAQFVWHPLLGDLQRTAAGLHGDWWRTITSLFVQDGGWFGTLSNLAFLLALGIAAERLTTRAKWLLAYTFAGLVGEFAGYAWQPVGGGNSVAICGLAGLVTVAEWRGDRRLPGFAIPVVILWCAAMLASWRFPNAFLVGGVLFAVLATRLSRAGWRWAGVIVAGAVLASGVLLAAVRNTHGAALLAGLLIAVTITYWPRSSGPRSSGPRSAGVVPSDSHDSSR